MAKLSKRTVDALEPRGRDYFVWDGELKGFGVRVMPSGRKVFWAQYRAAGVQRRVKLGSLGPVTVDMARTMARTILGDVAEGANPAQDLRSYRMAPTVAAVCDRFLEMHAGERCKPTTAREYRRVVERCIKPVIGQRKIGDVTRPEIAALHHELRHTPYQANRALSVLSKLFNLTEVWGLRPDGSNPCRHVAKYPERKRERFLSADELGRLGHVLSEAETSGSENLLAIAAFRLLILTGCRLSEIQTLKWEYVDHAHLRLPDSKTGARAIPIGPDVRRIIDGLPRLPGSPYVIAGTVPGGHLTDLQRPWRRIRAKAGLPGLRIHDLRHTFASNAIAAGQSLEMVGKLLGHTSYQTTMRYAHLADAPVREAAAQVSDGLARSLAAGRAAGAGGQVIAFPPPAGLE